MEGLEARALLAANELLVGFTGGSPSRLAEIRLARLGAVIEKTYPDGPSLIRLADGRDAKTAALWLSRTPGVRYATVNATIHVQAVASNDPKLASQWGLDNPSGIDIAATEAWGITTGSSGVVVAVIDSGVDVNHPDLAGQLWINAGEIPGNRIDDDHDGLIDDVNGWNYITNTGNVADDDGHGTHVAGIIAAATNNGIGVAGVAPGVKLMALKFLDANGNGDTSDAIDAIYYAVDHGAKVINASWGGASYEKPMKDAIQYAANHGVVFVTAAGNQKRNNDVSPNYPPSYRLSNMLVVAAIDSSGNLASFSNYGKKTVDLAAPGVNIVSTLPGGRYGSYSGTSMATPFVTGVVALLASQEPSLTATQLVQRVIAAARPLSSLTNVTVSGGIVDAYRTLAGTNSSTSSTPSQPPATQTQKAEDLHAALLGSSTYYARQGNSVKGFLSGLFRDVLGRTIDAASLRKWTVLLQRGTSRSVVAKSILTSDEARRTMIARWYIDDLGRPAGTLNTLKNSATVKSLARQIAAGTSPNAVRAGLLASDEYYSRQGGTPSALVMGLFHTLYARDPSPAELSTWTTSLKSGGTRLDMVKALMDTDEARATTIATWYREELGDSTSLEDLKRSQSILDLASATLF